ncbi:beta-galactosidase trimerization domain-containing protein [Micromonospora sp. NPDC000089]|uniref:beta-galactosidase trimerization domain-containing protein n=1 Tax=unclassified Micromonospora TaxID=2617518 RepID=UPI00369374EE
MTSSDAETTSGAVRYAVRDGTLQRNGRPHFSVGFNYHPSTTGCQYLQRWNAEQIDADFARMSELGFNTVRFFIFWADVEPTEGTYDPVVTERIRQFADLANRHGLQCLPSLLTIWMNGQRFDPVWRAGRDLWRDPDLVRRQIAYVHHVASALRDRDVLAYDIGDEVLHVDSVASGALSPAEVRTWWRALADSVRSGHPGALVLQANEASAVVGEHNFKPKYADPLDLVGIHGFPVWTPFHIESVSAPKASSFVPYLVRHASQDAAVLVDEFGSYGCGENTAQEYLRAAAHSAFASGAVGLLVWCWQDFRTEEKPYALRPNERQMGLLRADGRSKPAMSEFRSFARRVTNELAGFKPLPAPVGIHVLEHNEDGDAGYLKAAGSSAAAGFYAHQLLRRAHLPYEFTRRDLSRYQLVICPSVRHVTLADQQRLAAYVAQGGILYYSSGDLLHGFGGEELFGVSVEDFTLHAPELTEFDWAGDRYAVTWESAQIPVLKAGSAEVLGRFLDGSPALTRNRYGRGTAYYLNAPFELQLNAPHRLEGAPWHRLYARIARAAGVAAPVTVDMPEVEVTVLGRGADRCAVFINHAAEAVSVTARRAATDSAPAATEHIAFDSKGVEFMLWTDDPQQYGSPLHPQRTEADGSQRCDGSVHPSMISPPRERTSR